jgi:diguanylate cyclase (GGDEF)-like protein
MPVEISSRLVEAAGGRFIVSTVRDISKRKTTEEALHRTAEELRLGIASLEVRNRQISGLATMGRELQACSSSEEVWLRAAAFVEQLFPGSGGQLLVSRGPGSPLCPAAEWGPPREACPKTLGDCPAVRAAGLECVELQTSFGCREEGIEAGRFCICVPIETLGEPLGLLRLWEPDGHGLSVEDAVASHYGDLAVAAAEQISPVLSNLSLREALRDLAMRDPLTGLYNRRFLEEALTREVSRAAREKESLGVLMLDLDHFKDFNDAFGHEAGDDVLRCVGQFLRHRIRTTDVACRYGGEEFTILLPGATLEDARARAEQIRAGIRAALGSPGNVAASLGVAVFPDHGDSLAGLLRAADVALYRAKALGRDRVEIFGEG